MVWKPSTSVGFAINYNKGEFVGLFCDKMDDSASPQFDGKIGANCHDPFLPSTTQYYNKCFNSAYLKQANIKRNTHGASPLSTDESYAKTL